MDDWKKSGKITAQARDYARTICREGIPYLELANKIEAKIIELGGKPHAASGALWWKKSDAHSRDFQLEDKFTEKTYFSIKLSTLKKIEKEKTSKQTLEVSFHSFLYIHTLS